MAQAALKTCEICVSSPGSCYCLDCEMRFCENCKVLHLRQKISANHEFKEDSDFIPEVKLKCNDHNEVLSFFCIACDVPICVYCVTEKHNGHKLSQLKDTITNLKTKIKHDVLKKLNETRRNVSEFQKSVSEFDDQFQTVVRSIKEEGNTIKLMVDQYTAKRIASLQKQSRKESKRLASLLSENKSALDIAHTLDNRKRLIDVEKNDAILLKRSKSLLIDIDRLEFRPLPDFPSVTYNPKLVHENDISQLFGMYDFQETKIRTADGKIDKKPSPMRKERLYICDICGNQRTFPDGTSYRHLIDYFICCKKNMGRHYQHVFEKSK